MYLPRYRTVPLLDERVIARSDVSIVEPYGGGSERLDVKLTVESAQGQVQEQVQG